ncbi:hypothetical protein PA598K_02490 [Paenibacillus sp. 598K]|uniref:pectin acetylesterase-family hydrolase n=1 Tax=Paenibacillus sp. 598K TaxID=1117987 RepID=UPI000FF97C5E|nr:pectin acetylesterase-family hydrolase [Paenibacillus sp. 598K]GBF74159.1 hypothetical protein PA598K_02490 [Paenibacillus sp. 598K]
MKKWLKRLMMAIAVLIALLGAGVVVIYVWVIERPTDNVAFADMQPYVWNQVTLGDGAMNSDGTPYHLLTRKGESDSWIVFFSGGGAAWDAASAAQPIRLTNLLRGRDVGNYMDRMPWYQLTMLDGLLASEREDNPFRTWNVAYIPYSTGDFHIGNRQAEYTRADGEPFTMRYNGRTNVSAALAWVYEHMSAPDKLLIGGESAGGFGAAFWGSEIASRYPEAQVYLYSDSSFLLSERWPQIVRDEWQAEPETRLGFAPEADLIGAATRSNGRRLPDHAVILQSYSLYDQMLISFQRKLAPEQPLTPQDWSGQLRQAVAAMDEALPNYYYYVTDYGRDADSGMTGHTFATLGTLYETEQDGVRLIQWLGDLINGEQRYSVGGEFLER